MPKITVKMLTGTPEVLIITSDLLETDQWFTRKSSTTPDFWIGLLGYYLYDEGTRYRRN
jgi:hypothetical protein